MGKYHRKHKFTSKIDILQRMYSNSSSRKSNIERPSENIPKGIQELKALQDREEAASLSKYADEFFIFKNRTF